MALVGVFGLNLSPKSGGAYYLIKGLMENAYYSEHNYIYFHERSLANKVFPRNVESVSRSVLNRLAVQGLLRLPCADHILGCRKMALFVLCVLSNVMPNRFRGVEVWLWPHCFSPIPNLKPVVAICHDMIHRYHPEFFPSFVLYRRKKAEISMRNCARIVCPSNVVKKDLIHNYPEFHDKATTCWEAACEMVVREECEKESRTIRKLYGDSALFLYVAADWPHKNHELLIKAAIRLREMTDSPFRVVFVGPRRSNRIQRLIKEQKAVNLVVDIGGIARECLVGYYYAATALVFPSLHEGFGIPLVEAMQCGLPIIASDIASIPEVCGSAAVLLPPVNPNVWAHQMLTMMTWEEHRLKYSKLSLSRARKFTWQRYWAQMDRVLSDALSV